MANNKQVVKVTEIGIGDYLKKIKPNLSSYNHNCNMEEFIRSAMLMISEKQELRDCLKTTQGKSSLYHALKYATSTGLSLNPQEGKAALIAFGGAVQYQVMKNGMIELAMQSGKVEFITCDTVRENDDFTIHKSGSGDKYTYAPARKDRGNMDGFFAAVVMKDGTCYVKYMTVKEVEDHRDSYSALFRAKPAVSPWTKSFEGMALKTVVKALFRNVTISPDVDRMVGTDDQEENNPQDKMKDVTDLGFDSDDVKTAIEENTAKTIEVETVKVAEPVQDELDVF